MAAHILIIEDNDMSFVLADVLLRQAGHSTTRASDGGSGVQAALRNMADIVLCDLDLPVMSGYEVAAALRADPAWQPVPLLAFTAEAEEKILTAGFTGYILKPVDPQTFPAAIERHLSPDHRAS